MSEFPDRPPISNLPETTVSFTDSDGLADITTRADFIDLANSARGAEANDERPRTRTGWVVAVLLAGLLGVVLAALGTATHRTIVSGFPMGLVLALAMILAGALMVRAWRGLLTLAAMAAGWLIIMQILSLARSSGDVLLTDPSAAIPLPWLSVAFSWAGLLVTGVVAFLPRRWFMRA